MVSEAYEEYFGLLADKTNECYEIAGRCRAKGYDYSQEVEIPQAHDLADRTQKLLDFLHPRNTAEQIRELTEAHDGNRELVAFDIAKIVCAETYLYGKFGKCQPCGGNGTTKSGYYTNECDDCEGTGVSIDYKPEITTAWKDTLTEFEKKAVSRPDKHLAVCIYHGVCAGTAVLTEGILVAPLGGVVSCRVIKNEDDTKSLCINYAGPIRYAGGTGQALSVLIGDILRREFGFSSPQVTVEETERYKEEVSAYSRGLQYRPSNPELEVIAKNCPVYIDGEGVGAEVTGQRDLPRVPTNKVREGMLLVMCEGLVLKAPKILKYTTALGLDGWEWLRAFTKSSKGDDAEINPNKKFLSDMVAGRPIFSRPMATGGFRLRYGRSRLAGLATTACHPATMKAVSGFMIVGTQLKYERPGKGTVVTPCESIDGPYVQFTDGSGKRIQDEADIPEGLPIDPDWPIKTIWDLGELLVPVGEFLENNHILAPSPYVDEWHEQVLPDGVEYPSSFKEAKTQSIEHGIPIAPKYVALFDAVSAEDLLKCLNDPQAHTTTVYMTGMNITKDGDIYGDAAEVFKDCVGKTIKSTIPEGADGVWLINELADYEIKARGTLRIGARMGKPEGSKHREMRPRIHGLFPVGFKVGNKRLMRDAAGVNTSIELGLRVCDDCGVHTWKPACSGEDKPHTITATRHIGNKTQEIGWDELWADSLKKAEHIGNPQVKGVKGLTSKEKCPEPMVKGILRHKNDISVFRDGTMRFDMVDITMTHFTPTEIGMTMEQAHELGYRFDTHGEPLTDENQVVELKVQDIIIPRNCVEELLNATRFIDDLLVKLYGEKPYYQCETESDLIGQLAMGIAPHTSGAIVCRIVGVAQVKGHYGHPFFHAAKRRNCDGDIDAILLLLDGLVNFSRGFLPANRGGLMDAPIILTMRINPAEIDKEALNVETCWNYPVAFYELTHSDIPPPAKDALKAGVEIVESRLGKDTELEGFGYTHTTPCCDAGPKNNPYNTLESMRQKTMAQFALGETLFAVDNRQQASILIDRHLIRDMRGNLRAFGQQKVRCPKCGTSYRRAPISGKCMTIVEERSADETVTGNAEIIMCDGNIILTVTHGSVKKYDGLMEDLIDRYGCENYTEQLYEQVSRWVQQTFEDRNEKKQVKLF